MSINTNTVNPKNSGSSNALEPLAGETEIILDKSYGTAPVGNKEKKVNGFKESDLKKLDENSENPYDSSETEADENDMEEEENEEDRENDDESENNHE
jgi:hypothetical protein